MCVHVINIYISTVSKERGHEFKREQGEVLWKGLDGGNGGLCDYIFSKIKIII